MLRQLARAQVAARYNPFFKSVGMSQAETDKFVEAVVDSIQEHLVMTPLTITPSVILPSEDQLRALLGDERYQQFQDFNQVLPAFSFTNQAGLAAGLAGEPLSTDQKDRLVKVLVQHSAAYQANGPVSLAQVDWSAVMPEAQAVVSPTQWKAVQAAFMRMQLTQETMAASRQPAAQPTLNR